jgi:hypothetical protein
VFVILWSAISSGCIGLIYKLISISETSWEPGSRFAIAAYLVYWLSLASLQAILLLWKFRDKNFACQWFFTTSVAGFLVMLSHDLTLAALKIDTRGQGIIILIISIPCLAFIGGWLLGLAQYFVIRKFYRNNIELGSVNDNWFWIAGLSWALGFGGILRIDYIVQVTILLTAIGGAMKGWFLQKYLKAPAKPNPHRF